MDSQNGMMKVLCPITNERTSKTYWMRIGVAFPNRDGSTNVYLDAYPANGKLQIRELDERDRERANGRDGSEVAEVSATTDGLPF